MSLPRFLLTPQAFEARPLRLVDDERQHARVLRLKAGDQVMVADGAGRELLARVTRIGTRAVELEPLEVSRRRPEPELAVTLFQGLARGSKLEFIIQKTTELGLARLVPVVSEHSQVKPQPGREHRLERWRTVASQAARQSGRTRVPEIAAPCSFAESVAEGRGADIALLLDEAKGPEQQWKATCADLPRPKTVALFVGPEGSFSAGEKAQAQAAGIQLVGLGPRILRAETAGVIAVTLALFQWGDLGGEGPHAV